MASGNVEIDIKGIKELQRAFSKMDGEMKSALKRAFLPIAQRVASAVQGKVPRQSGKAAGSIKAKASNYGASIAFGGSQAEYYPWLDFGGAVGRNDSIKRPFIPEGRYVYPTIADEGDELEHEVDEAIRRLAESAGFETKQGL